MFVYPAIDLRDGRCVRLRQGDYNQETIFSDDPIAVAKQWVAFGAQRLHIVDLDGAKAGQPVNGPIIRQIVEACRVPCQLGGGIRTDDHLDKVFGWGVQWAVLGTKALEDPAWLRAAAIRYADRLVLGVDARDGYVATEGWLRTSRTKAIELAMSVEDAPLYAVVYTDIARDGMLNGPNFDSLAEFRAGTRLPVIASGGVSEVGQVQQLAQSHVFGCIVGRALYEGQVTLPELLAVAG
jgi:phosphoribosylformimino-5-aminoimidazole carboxamide ribotide isomerase